MGLAPRARCVRTCDDSCVHHRSQGIWTAATVLATVRRVGGPSRTSSRRRANPESTESTTRMRPFTEPASACGARTG
jgi:hypothetical protein